MPEIDWNSLKTAYAAGVGLREMARATGISENTLLSRAAKEGWTQQIEEAKALATVKVDEQSKAIGGSLAVINALQKYGDKTKLRLAKGISKGSLAVSKMSGEAIVEKAGNVKCLVDGASKLHGWGQDSEKGGTLVNINLLGTSPSQV